MMKVVNIISGMFLMFSALIRFGYMIEDGFNFFFMCWTFFIIFQILVIFAAEGALGPANSSWVRTYYNHLDGLQGRGYFMFSISLLLFAKCEKNEELFNATGLIIAMINMCLGYNDKIKELPAPPWDPKEKL